MKNKEIFARSVLFPAVCTALAYLILFGGNNMEITEWVAIGVALIGVVGTLIATLFQLRRDGKTIDSIGTATSEIKPTVNNIRDDTIKAKEVIVETIKPTLAEIEKRNKKIDDLASELEYQNRLKSSFSENAVGRDIMLAGITAVYEENARLNEQHRKDQEQIISLTMERNNIKRRLQKAEQELHEYRRNSSRDDYEPEI